MKIASASKGKTQKKAVTKLVINNSSREKNKASASSGRKANQGSLVLLKMIKKSLNLIDKEHNSLKKLKDEHGIAKKAFKESVSSLKKNISANTSSAKKLEHSFEKTEAKLAKTEKVLSKGFLKLREQTKSIMPIIAKYNKKSEQYLSEQIKKFEFYSKDKEETIDSKIKENSEILENALNTINQFIKEQENLRRVEIKDNIKDHRQIKADIDIIKEEFSTIISEYGRIEKDITEIKESELRKEENHILELIADLRKDIRDMDKTISAEKLKIKDVMSEIIVSEKKDMKKDLDSSKQYVDSNLKDLCTSIDALSQRNEHLIKALEKKDKNYENFKKYEMQDNLKDHRHMWADIDIIKEEFSKILSEYGKIENDITSIKESELRKEEKHILGLVTSLRKDVKDMDTAINKEKLNIKNIVIDIINSEKRDMEKSLDNSKQYVDSNVGELCSSVDALSQKNEHLATILERKDKEKNLLISDTINTQSQKIEELMNALEESRKTNIKRFDNATTEIRAVSENHYDNKLNEMVALMEKFKARDTEREMRVSDLMKRLEDTIGMLNRKSEDPEVLEKNVRTELDRMMSEFRQMKQENSDS
ncbi:MAG: hypothetical protein U9O53_05915 [archaeon]|nr:hypothetical protein [archaeon]